MLLHKNHEAFVEIVSVVAKTYGYQEEQIEKDYFVSLFLKELLSVSDLPIIFKGGTSLSKVYHLIDRFSEDLDLAVVFVGNRLVKSKRKKLKTDILSTISQLSMSLENANEIESDRDFNHYEITFDRNFKSINGILPHILVETILPYLPYPCATLDVSNYVAQYLTEQNRYDLMDQYQLQPFKASVQTLERTLIDKVFALCDYHLKGQYSRYSRHIYDIHKIWNSTQLNKDILVSLMGSIIRDRQLNGHNNISCQPGRRPNDILNDIIERRIYEDDFKNLTSNLLVKPVPYDVCIVSLNEIIASGLIQDLIPDFSHDQCLQI
jgi:hypothetical protein